MSAMTICGRETDRAGRFGRGAAGLLSRIGWTGVFGCIGWAGMAAEQFVAGPMGEGRSDLDPASAPPAPASTPADHFMASTASLAPLATQTSPASDLSAFRPDHADGDLLTEPVGGSGQSHGFRGPASAATAPLLASAAVLPRPNLVGRLVSEAFLLWPVIRGWDKTTKLLAGSAVGLIPWIVVLGLTLPSHTVARNWSTVWIGFDLLLAVAFGVTARLYLRNDPRVGIMAAVVATLLIVDCWFDTSTAADGLDAAESWASALFVEIPIAVFCAKLAWRSSLAMVRVPADRSPAEPSE